MKLATTEAPVNHTRSHSHSLTHAHVPVTRRCRRRLGRSNERRRDAQRRGRDSGLEADLFMTLDIPLAFYLIVVLNLRITHTDAQMHVPSAWN